MKRIISFSLWGNHPKYNIGAIENARLANKIYPDWVSRFYLGQSVPSMTIKELKDIPNTELLFMDQAGDWSGMFWRFLPAFDSNIDVMISRDTDSRLSFREKSAVDQWLESDRDFHIMRDHPFHNTAILGGMWGVRKDLLNKLNISLDVPINNNFWQVDQNFLRSSVYPIVYPYAFIHDSYDLMNESATHKFPTPRNNYEFVGEIYDEHNHRHPDHYTLL